MIPFLSRRSFGAGALAAGLIGRSRPSTAQELPRAGGTLVATWGGLDGSGAEPRAPYVPTGGGPGPTLVSSKVLERLARRGLGGFVGVLAESWRPALGFKSYTIRIRDGVTFHDGKPMTAADVAFSIGEIWKKHALPEAMADVVAVEAADEGAVTVRYSRPVPPLSFSALLCSSDAYVVPRHVYAGSDPRTNPANDAPIGTGPFKFRQWARGSHIELVRNERYWQKDLPHLERLIVRYIGDAADRAAALEAGEVQLGLLNAVTAQDAKRLAGADTFAVTSSGYDEPVWATTLECNLRRPALAKREVRQAMFHAIDRAFIARSIFQGRARPGTGPIFSTNKALYSVDIHRTAFSPSKAASLLDEAGYPKKKEDGKRLSLELVAAGWFAENVKVGSYLKQALEEVGVAVDLIVADRATALQRIYGDYDFDLAVSNQANPSEPVPWTTQYYTSSGIAQGMPFRNASGYSNPELDALVDGIKVEIDALKRRDMVAAFQRIVTRDAPLLPLVEHAPVTVAARRVQNHSNDPDFLGASWHDLWLAP